ncbi:MAG: putative transrane protein [Blastococcus sp.]|nr:putative transrane protein [Blastococcus sp.]
MTESRPPYPVRVDAWLDPSLSRWLWLVKWLLLVPHYVVLAFLWMGFVVVSVIAFFAILITGRYPRALFDFAVGVLRWTWRVHYYGYCALGTDRYPPFTLAEVSDYPARLDVPYPERLSRVLVLVKWWLLALPHYVVLAIFVGGGLSSRRGTNNGWINGWGAGGLVGLLVFIAAIVLLFTGRYPRALYDFVMGLDEDRARRRSARATTGGRRHLGRLVGRPGHAGADLAAVERRLDGRGDARRRRPRRDRGPVGGGRRRPAWAG